MNRKGKKEEKETMTKTKDTAKTQHENKEPEVKNRPDMGNDNAKDLHEEEATAAKEEDLIKQIQELNDKHLRLYSEFDNYRKRTLKERIELSKTASAELITQLLPVLDDFERAIKAFDQTDGTSEALKDGLVLIFNKFLSILSQQGLEQMKTIGEDFDTDFHEAITKIPAPTPEQKGKIVDEVEKGYLINGKVIRYAKVVVGS